MRLFEQGEFEEAAEAFDNLAQEAQDRGMVFQAANLTIQSARCHLRLDDLDSAYDRGMKGLELFKLAERPGAGKRLGERMVKILREKGRDAEALQRELGQLPIAPRAAAGRGELPGKCPQCGGPIKEAEVNWVGRSSAECPYCGSVVKAE
jgi:hypothetical protein